MTNQFSLQIDAWNDGELIPTRYAFGKPGDPMELSKNISPALSWTGAPEETKSFVVLMSDLDVPSAADDVNVEGREVPSELPRVDYFHWVLVDLPTHVTTIAEGSASNGVTPGGKPVGESFGGLTGANDYTSWFEGDAEMAGTYGSYDGPCPPWNDSIVHHYTFEVFAIDIKTLGLEPSAITGSLVQETMRDHIIASDSHTGVYSLNSTVLATL